jgi:hypothetical protein
MQTLDVFRAHDGELTVVMSGMAEPPSVANPDTGASIILTPARVVPSPASAAAP